MVQKFVKEEKKKRTNERKKEIIEEINKERTNERKEVPIRRGEELIRE